MQSSPQNLVPAICHQWHTRAGPSNTLNNSHTLCQGTNCRIESTSSAEGGAAMDLSFLWADVTTVLAEWQFCTPAPKTGRYNNLNSHSTSAPNADIAQHAMAITATVVNMATAAAKVTSRPLLPSGLDLQVNYLVSCSPSRPLISDMAVTHCTTPVISRVPLCYSPENKSSSKTPGRSRSLFEVAVVLPALDVSPSPLRCLCKWSRSSASRRLWFSGSFPAVGQDTWCANDERR